MDVGFGEIANRIITVGSVGRAEIIATFLDKNPSPQTINSSRGFTTITGYYQGKLVSIVAIGMGPSMMDFFVRETRAVTKGPLAIVRFGTCGGISSEAPGSIVVASRGSGYITRNPDAFTSFYKYRDDTDAAAANSNATQKEAPYLLYKPAPADGDLSILLYSDLVEELGSEIVVKGMNVTAESFYSSQGRVDENFDDDNKEIIDTILKRYPEAKTLEMETFMLLHLANCSKIPIYASACAIVVANRCTAKVIDETLLNSLESRGGKAILDAIIKKTL